MISLSDPRPAFCSACHQAQPDQRYVDFDAAHDGGAFVNEAGTYIAGSDDLHLCEPCLREALELLELKPEQHARLLSENKRLNLENEHWREQSRRLKDQLNSALDDRLGEPRKRRPVAA